MDQSHHPHRRRLALLAILPVLSLAAAAAELQGTGNGARGLTPRQDIHSYARPQEAVGEHLDLDLSVDFARRELAGTATWRLRNPAGTDTLWLDTNGLTIDEVRLGDGEPTTFRLGDPEPWLGRSLAISLRPGTTQVTIRYRTSPDAEALQWLEPAQTADGKHPFLFSQSQAILARTWVPCQDTPGVRFTYTATVRVPPSLLAVMSAENATSRSADGVYRFAMPQAIPSYLLALAVGDLDFAALDSRTGVWAERSVLAGAAAELSELPAMMDATEALYGPYRWGRYDVLVLPPSFPFGGMENPRLTFATPTILAGDKSLVALIAHELAHSWSGNLVTNATWDDFWLNESFTVYLERRIMEALRGRDYAEMLAGIGLGDLRTAIEDLGNDSPDTRLRLDLTGRNPDDGGGDVAYEKGYYLLRLIEESVGRDRFDPFLRSWFDEHAFQSVTTDQFLAFLDRRLLDHSPGLAERIGVRRWIDGAGLPDNLPLPVSDRFAKVEAAAARIAAGATPSELPTAGWSSHEWVHFLRSLPRPLPKVRLAALDAAFHLNDSGNSEITFAWFLHAIASRYEPAYPALERFLLHVGRRKFVEPLYEAMAAQPETRPMAERIYRQARRGYHPVTRAGVDPILGWADESTSEPGRS